MDAQFVNGIESIELNTNFAVPAWVPLEEIEMGSVTWGVTAPTRTRIKAEDKPGTRVSLLGEQEPDVLGFGTINLNQENLALLFGGTTDDPTGTFYVPGETLQVKMQVRMTTRPVNGIKQIITFENTEALATFTGSFTRDGVMAVRVSADILTFDNGAGLEVKATIQNVTPLGVPIPNV